MFRIVQALNNNVALVKNEQDDQACHGARDSLSKEKR